MHLKENKGCHCYGWPPFSLNTDTHSQCESSLMCNVFQIVAKMIPTTQQPQSISVVSELPCCGGPILYTVLTSLPRFSYCWKGWTFSTAIRLTWNLEKRIYLNLYGAVWYLLRCFIEQNDCWSNIKFTVAVDQLGINICNAL